MRGGDRRKSVVLTVLTACVTFLVLDVVVCMAVYPQALQHPGWGLSQFGSHRATLLPYYAGFAVVVASLGRIAWLTRHVGGRWRHVRPVFGVTTAIMAGIGASSANLNAFFLWTHISLCVALGITILLADIWLIRQPETGWIDYVATATAVAGMLVTLFSIDAIAIFHATYWGEVVVFLSAFLTFCRAALEAVSGNAKDVVDTALTSGSS